MVSIFWSLLAYSSTHHHTNNIISRSVNLRVASIQSVCLRVTPDVGLLGDRGRSISHHLHDSPRPVPIAKHFGYLVHV